MTTTSRLLNRISFASSDRFARGCAVGSALSFAGVSVGLAKQPDAFWVECFGIAFHLTLLPVVTELKASRLARAMGYAWIAVDIFVSVLLLSGQDRKSANACRLSGHVLAGVWIGGTLHALPPLPRWLGGLLAFALAGHSLLAPLARPRRPYLLFAAGPLMVLWLAAVSIQWQQRSLGSDRG